MATVGNINIFFIRKYVIHDYKMKDLAASKENQKKNNQQKKENNPRRPSS